MKLDKVIKVLIDLLFIFIIGLLVGFYLFFVKKYFEIRLIEAEALVLQGEAKITKIKVEQSNNEMMQILKCQELAAHNTQQAWTYENCLKAIKQHPDQQKKTEGLNLL